MVSRGRLVLVVTGTRVPSSSMPWPSGVCKYTCDTVGCGVGGLTQCLQRALILSLRDKNDAEDCNSSAQTSKYTIPPPPAQIIREIRTRYDERSCTKRLQRAEPRNDMASLVQVENLLYDDRAQRFSLAGSNRHDISACDVRLQTSTVGAPETSEGEHNGRQEIDWPAADGMGYRDREEVANAHVEGWPGCEVAGLWVAAVRGFYDGQNGGDAAGH